MLYPSKTKKNHQTTNPKIVSYKNRGMNLEHLINESNKYYLDKDIAVIYKKPTPIQAVKVAYKNSSKIIEKGYFASVSTLDYNGIYKGYYLDFEAKETKSSSSFPLSNIHPHQIEHLKKVLHHGGITFLIIKINGLIYLLDGKDFVDYLNTHNRKSIAYTYIKEFGYLLKVSYQPALDYLKIIDKIISKNGVI